MSWVGYAAAEFAPVVACAHKAAILVLRPTAIISGAEIPQAQQPPITSTCAILSIGSTGGDGNALFRQNDSCLTEGPKGNTLAKEARHQRRDFTTELLAQL